MRHVLSPASRSDPTPLEQIFPAVPLRGGASTEPRTAEQRPLLSNPESGLRTGEIDPKRTSRSVAVTLVSPDPCRFESSLEYAGSRPKVANRETHMVKEGEHARR